MGIPIRTDPTVSRLSYSCNGNPYTQKNGIHNAAQGQVATFVLQYSYKRLYFASFLRAFHDSGGMTQKTSPGCDTPGIIIKRW